MSSESTTRTFVVTTSNHDLSPSIDSTVSIDSLEPGSLRLRICDAVDGATKEVTAVRDRLRRGSRSMTGAWSEGVAFSLTFDSRLGGTLRCNFDLKRASHGSDAWTAEEEGP